MGLENPRSAITPLQWFYIASVEDTIVENDGRVPPPPPKKAKIKENTDVLSVRVHSPSGKIDSQSAGDTDDVTVNSFEVSREKEVNSTSAAMKNSSTSYMMIQGSKIISPLSRSMIYNSTTSTNNNSSDRKLD